MSDADDQDLTIKVLRARCAELEAKLKAAEEELARARADIAAIYDAQNG